ncbi:MAG: hypothetical protein LIP03_01630 [Bacteroidales bacterium]|nr:hypothetical protein [Bacteroidales bacterium]
MKEIVIGNQKIELHPLSQAEEKKAFVDARATFSFYKAVINDDSFVVLEAKNSRKLRPLQMLHYSAKLEQAYRLPIVFLFDYLKTTERDRLIDKGIYFVVSGNYAFLPYLIVNRKIGDRRLAEQFAPMQQRLLLYHLQKESFTGKSISGISSMTGATYVSTAKAIALFEEMGLCTTKKRGKTKIVVFPEDRRQTWEQSKPHMSSPVKESFFTDDLHCEYPQCGINALSRYTAINPEAEAMYAIMQEDVARFNSIDSEEGKALVQVWKYLPIVTNGCVDPLSLFLSLKDEKDPRVEKELEKLVEQLW